MEGIWKNVKTKNSAYLYRLKAAERKADRKVRSVTLGLERTLKTIAINRLKLVINKL